jgi:hypothetical protein
LKKGHILPGFDEIQMQLIHIENENYVGFDFCRLTSTLLKQGRTTGEVEGINYIT